MHAQKPIHAGSSRSPPASAPVTGDDGLVSIGAITAAGAIADSARATNRAAAGPNETGPRVRPKTLPTPIQKTMVYRRSCDIEAESPDEMPHFGRSESR